MNFNNFILKIIACILMTIDHIGGILLPNSIILRIVGRLSFPIFAFLITEGYDKTKNIQKYQRRLLIFSFVSQIPYSITFKTMHLNIFFTLLAGLYSIKIINKDLNITMLAKNYQLKINNPIKIERFIKILLIILICILCDLIGTDYGSYGVLIVVIFSLFKNDIRKLIISFSTLNVMQLLLQICINTTNDIPIEPNVFLQIFSIFSLFIIKKYNNERGPKLKYGFYIYYPLHLIVLTLVQHLFYI